MPQSSIEKIEKLEQLRVLEAGHSILVGVVDEPTFGIDTPDDYRAFVEKQSQPASTECVQRVVNSPGRTPAAGAG